MADSRRSLPADGRAHDGVGRAVADLLAQALPGGGRVAVALSGGRDSIALLDAASRIAGRARITLVAFHVHHGLSPNADRWSLFCRDACAARDIAFVSRHVSVARNARVSVEAAARKLRYDALAALAQAHAVDAVLLGHHADDQAETVLLQLLRGAGPRGLAAMPAIAVDRGVRWLRPLLGITRQALDAEVTARRLDYIDDESNADARYRRNALRARAVPALRAIAPGYPDTLVRAARHQAEAAALLDELAALDAQGACDGATLDRAVLRSLGAPRARNLLRWFVRQHGLPAPSSARLGEMLRQLTSAGDDARTALVHAGSELGVHRGRVCVHRRAPDAYSLRWTGDGSIVLPHGTLVFEAAATAGIAARHLAAARVTLRSGTPGERLRVGGHLRRGVADLLREAGVPAWARTGVPRVYCGDVLAAVACAGVDAAFAAAPGEPAVALGWHPG